MTTLVAIGFPNETTASAAAEHLHRSAPDIVLDADGVAVINRDDRGAIHVTTSHQAMAHGSSHLRGVFWPPLFSALCLIPLLHMPVGGEWLILLRKMEQAGLVDNLREPVLDMLQPGTSILFLALDPTTPIAAVVGVQRRFGGSVVTAELPPAAERDIHEAFHGAHAHLGGDNIKH